METQEEKADEKVLVAAAHLFSELGYDLTTLGMVADAVGREGAGSELLRQGKEHLYHQVLARFNAMERERLEAAVRESPEGPEGIHRLVDAFCDFVVDHPEVSALWQQRGLKDAADLRFPEEEFPPPLMVMMTTHSWQGLKPDPDLEFISWMVLWTVGGFVHNTRYTRGPAIRHFRARLHAVLDQLV